MKTIKQIMKERGLQEKNKFDHLLEAEDEREKEFRKRLKGACKAADIDVRQFSVQTKNDGIEIKIPLNKLVGPATREFCADRWNSFFEGAGLDVDFLDNIDDALDDINVIVPLTFNRQSFQEIE